MRRRSWAAIGGVFLSVALCGTASAQFSPGARTLGDPYYPNTGNGGYDAQHYDLTINYDPVAHTINAATQATMRATQALSEFSLDFVGSYAITSVKVNGADAAFTRDVDPLTYKHKLVITPAAGIANDTAFTVEVAYNGTPQNFVDPDASLEGFMRTTASLGAFVMNEPVGAMAWFPNNNHPRDKATFDFHLTAPVAYSTAGNGELVSKVDNGDGTATWHWHLGYPMASYLSTSTIGLYDFVEDVGATAVGAGGRPLKTYSYIESALPETSANPANTQTKTANRASIARQDAIVKFIADTIGAPYPYDSHGVVSARAPAGGTYALEVQTKSHFGNGIVNAGTLAHEIAHQWFGDSVGPASWREIWFNEGWATWWATYWANKQNGSPTTNLDSFNAGYDATNNPTRWNTAPAALGGPDEMFDTFPVYTRPSMMYESYRQIVGDTAFFAFQKALVTEHAYGTISQAQFVALAKRIAAEKAGLEASNLDKLDRFFDQWLNLPAKPPLTHRNFFLSTTVPNVTVSGTVPATLSLTLGATPTFGGFAPGVTKSYESSSIATITSTAGDATLSVVDPSATAPGHLVNGAFSLAQALQAKAGTGAYAPVSGTPLSLLTYSGPVSGDPVTIGFKQDTGSTEPLRTGTYSKTLTYTLSTTNP